MTRDRKLTPLAIAEETLRVERQAFETRLARAERDRDEVQAENAKLRASLLAGIEEHREGEETFARLTAERDAAVQQVATLEEAQPVARQLLRILNSGNLDAGTLFCEVYDVLFFWWKDRKR